MFTNFKISTPDGNEHFVKSVDELKRRYREGHIAANILIRPLSDDKWLPLNEMFNLDEWEQPSANADTGGHVPPPAANPTTEYYGPGPSVLTTETPSFRGKRVAGCLIIAEALFTLGMVGLRNYLPAGSQFAVVSPFAFYIICAIDFIIGLALYFGLWRSFALFRITMAILFFGVDIFGISHHSLRENLSSFFQLTYSIAFIILLKDEIASLVRTLVGAGVIVFAEIGLGVIALVFTWPAPDRTAQVERQFKAYIIQDRHFKDIETGVTLDVPNGWLLVQKDNPITKFETARMIAIDPRDEEYAVLFVDYLPNNDKIRSVDDFIDVTESGSTKNVTWKKEINRSHVDFGNETGERVEIAWENNNNNKFHGWRSVCRRGEVYYRLVGWCLESRHNEGFLRYKELEQRFTLTTFPDAK